MCRVWPQQPDAGRPQEQAAEDLADHGGLAQPGAEATEEVADQNDDRHREKNAASVAHLVPGGHFFPFDQPAAVLDYLTRDPERLGEPTTG